MTRLHWPLFDLVVRTPVLELRHPDDETCARLAEIASPDMFPEGENQFRLHWTAGPSPERERQSMQWWWRARAGITPESWHLTLAVLVGGEPAGVQDLVAEHFLRLRSVTTGSWLAKAFQGKGYGKEMRQAALHLAFVGLGALEAHSSAFESNERSKKVSRSLGYSENGECRALRGEEPDRSIGFRIDRAAFEARRRDDIAIENLAPCLPIFGL